MRTLILLLLCVSAGLKAQHPVAFATPSEFAFIKKNITGNSLAARSFADLKKTVDPFLITGVDVPVPKDPAGGYTHDRHKENYSLMFNAGILYNITGDKRYANFVKQTLQKYARLNPELKIHPEATSKSPGHIFWQALNDANWLVYTGMAYDLVINTLTTAEKKEIENGAFKPEVDFLTGDLESWFNLVHNHGVWACAGVGIVGIATNNEDYIQKALYGTKKDGNGGFLAQLSQLFSPDGYYTEGAYYVRYAILPFYVFANALDHAKPGLKIFEYRDRILKKALASGLQQTNTDGRFFPFNDAMREKDFTANEIMTAIAIARKAYGKNEGLRTIASKQNRVLVHPGGVMLSEDLRSPNPISETYPFHSVEFTDGADGKQGGLSLLRSGNGINLTTLGFKYASHGLSHGHFDQLGIFLYDKGNPILQDYGSVRFVGIEQKFGGRYLPENDSYAAQTIAHNTIAADENSHFYGNAKDAEKYNGEKLFSSIGNNAVQVVSAKQKDAYKDIELMRTVYLVNIPGYSRPVVIDLFAAFSPTPHQYDLPFQYSGTVINTSFKYKSFTSSLETLGSKNGYQFLWKDAEATVSDTTTQFTFLNGTSFYTISSVIRKPAKIFITHAGANDPDFNLRREPSYIIRKSGSDQLFVNVIELHGRLDHVGEFSTNAYPSVEKIHLLYHEADYTAAEIVIKGKKLVVAQSNKLFEKDKKHELSVQGKTFTWTGPYLILFDGKKL
jgi:oligo-alginate lyase